MQLGVELSSPRKILSSVPLLTQKCFIARYEVCPLVAFFLKKDTNYNAKNIILRTISNETDYNEKKSFLNIVKKMCAILLP